VLRSAQDYYPFGMTMPGRNTEAKYRYGFNGKETDPETGIQDYGMRWYLPNIARFPSVDPITKKYPELTPYQFASNTPIAAIDIDGLEGAGVAHEAGAPPTPDHLWASRVAYDKLGGDDIYTTLPAWSKLGTSVTVTPPNNMVNINETPSAREHNERISGLNNQFHINKNVAMSEANLVNLLLGSFFRGTVPENLIFPKDGFGSELLRNSPQVNEALKKYITTGAISGKASTPSVVSSLSNEFSGNFKLEDFIGSIDYSIALSNDKSTLTLTMTNVTSITSGCLGKELFGSKSWPKGVVKEPTGDTPNGNFAQTFSLTFKVETLREAYQETTKTPEEQLSKSSSNR
jgi:RHS repeat-associated protein